MLYNVLNFPAGVVPVSTVTEADEEELKFYQGCCDDPWDRALKQVWEVVEQRLLMGVQVTVSMISRAPKYLHRHGHSTKKFISFLYTLANPQIHLEYTPCLSPKPPKGKSLSFGGNKGSPPGWVG